MFFFCSLYYISTFDHVTFDSPPQGNNVSCNNVFFLYSFQQQREVLARRSKPFDVAS